MGLLFSRKFCNLELVRSKQGLKTHAPLWRIWTSIFLSLTIYLLSLRKIMASYLISPSSLSQGSPTRWCLISVPVVLVMEIYLNPCTGVVFVYLWCLKNSENSSPPLFFSAVVQQCETRSRFERKADLHPYNMFMEAKNNAADGIESGISQGNLPKKNGDRNTGISKPVGEKKSDLKLGGYENKITTQREFQTPITAQLNKGHNTGSAPGMQETSNYHIPGKWEKGNTKTTKVEKPTKTSEENINSTSPVIELEEHQLQNQEEDMEEYVDEQFDYEFEDLIVDEPLTMDEPLNPLPLFPNDEISPILISEDPPFSEKDLEDFINNGARNGDVDPAKSEGSFHTILMSNRSSASVVAGMKRLDVHNTSRSTSTSSKRKFIDGVEDTASSGTKEGKKTKN